MTRQMGLFFILCALGGLYIIFYGVTFKNCLKPRNTLKMELICETIHIGIVCLKHTYNIIDLYTIVKAILFYRNAPINLHLLTDDESETIVRTLFDTWSTHQVSVNIYNVNTLPSNFHWITNKNTPHDILKLMFLVFVPENVLNLLVMDATLFCVGDIDTIWQMHYQKSDQIQIISNEYWLSEIWIVNLADVRLSEAFDTFSNNISSNQSNSLDRDIILNSFTVHYRTIDLTHIRCSLIEEIQKNNQLTPMYEAIVNFNSEVLLDLSYCHKDKTVQPISKIPIKECVDVEQVNVKYFNYRTLLLIAKYKYIPQQYDITMVTQMSFEKFPVFEIMCSRWAGPVSVALYIKEEELIPTMNFIRQSKKLKKRENIAYHIVIKKGKYQPVNKLRNVALQYVSTKYVFLNDVDFVPGPNVYSDVKSHIEKMKTMNKKALIIPAFQAMNNAVHMPVNLSETFEMWNKNQIIPFHQKYFPPGHRPTDYNKFKTAKAPYTIKWQPNYEPYVVVESSVPKYDERFVGYIWNKIQHILELDAAGYEFIVLQDTFLVHKYHEKSSDFNNYLKSKKYYPCMIALKKVFLKELNIKYNCNYKFENFKI